MGGSLFYFGGSRNMEKELIEARESGFRR